MTIYFPEKNKTYFQDNRSNVYPKGNIWSSLNLDFQSNVGVLRVAPRLLVNVTTSDLANLGCPVAFQRYGTAIYTVAGARVFLNTGFGDNLAFAQDASTDTPTDCSSDYSDLMTFNLDDNSDVLVVTTVDAVTTLSNPGGTWTERDSLSSSTTPHKLLYFRKFNRMYWSANDHFINSMDVAFVVADTGDYTLNWNNGSLDFVDFKASTESIWIAMKASNLMGVPGNLGAPVWRWDGISAQPDKEYMIPGEWGIAAIVIDETRDSPIAIGMSGIWYEFNGTGFVEMCRFPFTSENMPYAGSASITSGSKNDAFIHPNGVVFTQNNTIVANILGINNDNGATQNENVPSGVWEWSKETGLVHRTGFTYAKVASSITDWGQNRISRAGAISVLNLPSTTSGRDGTMLVGANIFTNASDTTSVVAYDNSINTIQKKGYAVTTWFESDQIADNWDVFWATYRRFRTVSDSIVPKIRFVEEPAVTAAITWVTSTTFTVLNSAVDIDDYWTEGTGGEVEILRGVGGSGCAHITNAVNNAGTWTVTIDEELNPTAATSTATARFQKWIKIFPANSTATPANWEQFAMGEESQPRVQLKLCFTFTGNGEYYKGVITSTEDIKANK